MGIQIFRNSVFLAALLFFTCICPVYSRNFSKPAEKQAVLETSLGLIAIELYPDAAPVFVEGFRDAIREGFYTGTIFHRPIAMALIQGGDPVSADPDRKSEYGTGGLMQFQVEKNDIPHKRGSVAVVTIPNEPGSAGNQFFICVTDQPQLDGSFAVFGQVVEGISVVETLSKLPVDPNGLVIDRVEITKTYERDTPPPEKLPFEGSTPAEMAGFEARIITNLGDLIIHFFPQEAPENVRRFLRFAQLGFYDGTLFHRVVTGFVIQGGALFTRKEPVGSKYSDLIVPVKGEFSNRKHVRGTVSLARGDDPDSGVDSFFIVLDSHESLDGNFTIFGEVVNGMDTVDGISQAPVLGEKPIFDILIERIIIRLIE
jgi:cyclophilin family peptidyl-prolyl cis-trans isomerase